VDKFRRDGLGHGRTHRLRCARRPNACRGSPRPEPGNGLPRKNQETIAGLGALSVKRSSKCWVGKRKVGKRKVGTVYRLHGPPVLEKLGCVLRAAMDDMAKEELPHDLARLLARLAQLESARPRRRRASDEG